MFRRYRSGRRPTNVLFVIFRLFLSVVIFALLLAGIYSAYKHLSGLDPLKLDPQAVISNLINSKSPKEVIETLSSLKVTQDLATQNYTPNLAFKFLLVADSHNDNVNLNRALSQAKQEYPDLQFIIGMGDYTEVGTIDELKIAKKEFDLSGLRYFLLVGDHDLWDSRDKQSDPTANFKAIFGPVYQSFTYNNFRFVILYNSDNYIGIGEEQQKWVTTELEKAKQEQVKAIFVFVHEPLYHPSSDHVMGRIEQSLKSQAKILIHQLKDAGVKKVFAGDIHYFSEYAEPETNLSMVTIGAITTERNPQAPRFAVVSVFDDGSIKMEDREIK